MIAVPADQPKVSVCLVTYNHEPFIEQAIQSVLAQDTSFPIEIVIGDDCSTDRTREIIAALASKFPNRIRPFFQEANRGLVPNFIDTYDSCRGEYVALLDGDDYWTSSEKLAKQIRFLDDRPACSICFHDVAVLLADGTFCPQNYTNPAQQPFAKIDDLLRTNFIATCSAVFRRHLLPRLPEWFGSLEWEDWALYILLAEQGTIGYLPDVLGVYRLHGRGLWSRLDRVARIEAEIRFLKTIDVHLDYQYTAGIKRSVEERQMRLADESEPR